MLFCLVGAIAIELGLRKMVLGRWVYAVGSNDKASRLSAFRSTASGSASI